MVGLVVDREGQLEVAWAIVLKIEGPAASPVDQDGAAGACYLDEPAVGNRRADALDGVGDMDVGIADFGGDEEGVGGEGQQARHHGEGCQQHGARPTNGRGSCRSLRACMSSEAGLPLWSL